jgi:membrane-bound metal-dependent hydrolase YbcI (DUF457 family)
MTRGTHQVGAFAAALGTLALLGPLVAGPVGGALALVGQRVLGMPIVTAPVGWPSLLAYLVAALLGGTAPDLDQPKQVWARALAHTAFGGHRHLSHSLVGLVLIGGLAGLLAEAVAPALGLAPLLLWFGFLAGYVSHLGLDSLTVEGVPWLFPVPVYLGLPPWSGLRLRTGGLIEQLVVMPLLLGLIGWIGYAAGAGLLAWG